MDGSVTAAHGPQDSHGRRHCFATPANNGRPIFDSQARDTRRRLGAYRSPEDRQAVWALSPSPDVDVRKTSRCQYRAACCGTRGPQRHSDGIKELRVGGDYSKTACFCGIRPGSIVYPGRSGKTWPGGGNRKSWCVSNGCFNDPEIPDPDEPHRPVVDIGGAKLRDYIDHQRDGRPGARARYRDLRGNAGQCSDMWGTDEVHALKAAFVGEFR